MSSNLPTLAPVARRPLARVSAFDLSWDARHHSLDAITGQAGTGAFTTANNLIGSDGTTLAALTGMPRWQMLDIEAGVTGRETAGLLMGSGDTLAWPIPLRTDAATLLLGFVQPASFPASGKGLLYCGDDAISGARWYVDSSGSQYRLTYHNGTSSVTSTMTGTAPTSGQVVWLRGTRSATGAVQLYQTINEAAETTPGASGTLTPVAFGSPCIVRLNGIGLANTTAFTPFRVIVTTGTWALSALRNRF